MSTKRKPTHPPAAEYIDPEIDGGTQPTPADHKSAESIIKAIADFKAAHPDAKRMRLPDEIKGSILDWIKDYDAEHGRGGTSKAADAFGIPTITLSTWKPKSGEAKVRKPRESKADKAPEIDEVAFLKVMIGKGWKFEKLVNALTGETVSENIPAAIKALNLKFEPIPKNAEGIYINQTSPQIQVSMSLDRFLEVAKLKP